MGKLPASQWYWADWMKDPAVRSVTYAARGLWMDMLSLMHENGRRGYLQVNGKPATLSHLARMTGGETDEVSRLLQELESAGVFSRSDDGTIYSRRMVRDEHKRNLCSEAGRKGGGNPTFKGPGKGGSKPIPNPSSSISSTNLKPITREVFNERLSKAEQRNRDVDHTTREVFGAAREALRHIPKSLPD